MCLHAMLMICLHTPDSACFNREEPNHLFIRGNCAVQPSCSAHMYCNTTLPLQVRELQTALEAKRAACDRQERQLQLSANQRQRQHNVEEQYNEALRRLRSAETTIQGLQANVQVS